MKEEEQIPIPYALSCPDIADTRNELATPDMVLRQPRIAHFAKHFPKFNPKAEVLLLIGRNVGRAMATKCLSVEEPYVHKTPLGYSLVGSPCMQSSIPNALNVFRTSVPFDPVEVKLSFTPKIENKLKCYVFQQKPDDDVQGAISGGQEVS